MKMLEIAPKYSSLQHCNMYIFAIVPWGQGTGLFLLGNTCSVSNSMLYHTKFQPYTSSK